jgi:hypothetical protein
VSQDSEHTLMNEIRVALSRGDTRLFRQNSGEGWTGQAIRLPDGSVLIKNPRRLIAGFPGLADLGGWRTVTVRRDMVGRKLAVYVAVEVKTKKGRATAAQDGFLEAVVAAGGIAAVARSVGEARAAMEVLDKTLEPCVNSIPTERKQV